MTRKDLKEIIVKVIEKMQKKGNPPVPACMYGDGACDVTTKYAIGEEG